MKKDEVDTDKQNSSKKVVEGDVSSNYSDTLAETWLFLFE